VAQWRLHHRLRLLVLRALTDADPAPTVLELSAGHGPWSDVLLAEGARTTLVEMDPEAPGGAGTRSGTGSGTGSGGDDRFRRLVDPGATLDAVGDGFDLALLGSVQHHVPDYLALLDRVVDRLAVGGSLLTMQDPLWYPRLGRTTRVVDRTAYLAWRLAQGEVAAGARAWGRRVRGSYPEERPGGLTYYHVVRSGVDESAVTALLRSRFARVDLVTYWSNHLAAVSPLAERAGMRNTFAVWARALRA
jgi:hypothetical protein